MLAEWILTYHLPGPTPPLPVLTQHLPLSPHPKSRLTASSQSSPRKRWLSIYSGPGPMLGAGGRHPTLKCSLNSPQ